MKRVNKGFNLLSTLVCILNITVLVLIAGGCQLPHQNAILPPSNRLLDEEFNRPPQIRRGYLPSSTLGTSFLGYDNPLRYSYKYSLSKKEGIVYTCKGGHIDISHVYEAADWTAYLSAKTYKHLVQNDSEFSFRLKEDSVCFVHLAYPVNWQNLSQKEKEHIAFDVAVRLGQYFGYTAGTWHEMLTWFGYKSKGIFSEFPSAFSWEDIFSNLLGSNIGALALRDTKHTYAKAVTYILNEQLEKLDIQSAKVGKHAAEKVRGTWFSGKVPPFVNMKMRNFDIGLDDGFVAPLIVNSICECEGQKARPCPVPNLQFLAEYGFSMRLEIEPREWEKNKILSVVYHDKKTRNKHIEPIKDFAAIMSKIKRDAQKAYGPNMGAMHQIINVDAPDNPCGCTYSSVVGERPCKRKRLFY